MLRFHPDRTGHGIHPNQPGEPEVDAFLTHLAVNRRVAESTQNQALGAIRSRADIRLKGTWARSMPQIDTRLMAKRDLGIRSPLDV